MKNVASHENALRGQGVTACWGNGMTMLEW